MTTTTATVLTGCLAPEPATAPTGCLAPIDKNGLEELIAAGKADPKVIKTLKCKTVAEGRFRHLNFIRSLPPYIVDEPPGLLGDDTAPNPSEASLAALGSCLAVGLHANAVHRGWTVRKLELAARRRPQHHRRVGHRRHVARSRSASPTCASRSTWNATASRRKQSTRSSRTCSKWSPVANTFTRPVNLEVSLA